MAYELIGRVKAVNQAETIASASDPSKTFTKRKLLLDCSRYDSITGERLLNNYPLLEFGGKGLEQLNELCANGLKQGDLVSVEFAVQGNNYKDAQGNTKNHTGIRPYSISRYVPRSQQPQQVATQPQVQQPQQSVQQPVQTQQPPQQPQNASPFPPPTQVDNDNDLPF